MTKRSNRRGRDHPDGASLFDDCREHWSLANDHKILRYAPKDGVPPSGQAAPSCQNCCHNGGACKAICEDIKPLLPNDYTGKAKKEYTNELDLESHAKLVATPSSRDFSRLLDVPHIYTAQQLAAVRLTHQGESRPAICRKLGVSNSRVSQLVKGALNRFEHHEARLRALTAVELKRLGASASEGDKDPTLTRSQQV